MITHFPIYETIVLCSGKSGSSTIWKTMLNNGYTSLHTHTNWYYKNILRGYGDLYDDIIQYSICHFGKIYIIDSYRTPIERRISAAFQEINTVFGKADKDIPNLIRIFNTTQLRIIDTYNSINEAFEHYTIPRWNTFDFDRGYNIKEVENKVFIKVRFADIKNWGSIFTSIFGKPITMYNDNITDNKDYATIYKEFKEQYRVPRSFLEELKSDPEFNTYTTPKEREDYFAYWYARSIDE